jgi:hypothetical protein
MKAFGCLLLMIVLLCHAQEALKPPVLPAPLEQPPQRPGLEIHAERTSFSMASNLVVYSSSGTNRVVAIYPPAKTNEPAAYIRCRTLTGKQLPDGRVDFIEAQGDVQIERGEDWAVGQRAIYVGTNDQVVLTGPWNFPPYVSPRPILYKSRITNTADVIIYNRLTNELFMVGNVKTYIPDEVLQKTSTTDLGVGTNASPKRPLP